MVDYYPESLNTDKRRPRRSRRVCKLSRLRLTEATHFKSFCESCSRCNFQPVECTIYFRFRLHIWLMNICRNRSAIDRICRQTIWTNRQRFTGDDIMARQVKTGLRKNRISYNNVVDHRSQQAIHRHQTPPPGIATPPEEDRATVTGDLHNKFREDRSSGSRDMLADRQAHTRRQIDR